MKQKLFILIILINGMGLLYGQKASKELPFEDSFEAISEGNIFKDPGYFNWGASIIKAEDGTYHLFYSRWADDFSAWLTYSEIAHARSDMFKRWPPLGKSKMF